MIFYNILNLNPGKFSVLPAFEKLICGKVFSKKTVTLWENVAYIANLFVFITYDNYYYW